MLTTQRAEYLLGEPVLLNVEYKNLTQQAIQATVGYDVGSFEIDGSKDNEHFHRILVTDVVDCAIRSGTTLQPGESCHYPLRVLQHHRKEGVVLAFEKPGIYWLKVAYPNYPDPIPSNAIQINIKQPEGSDAIVWQRMQHPHFCNFLQWGELSDPPNPGDKRVPLYPLRYAAYKETAIQSAVILEQFPTTGYRDALQFALRKVYHRQRDKCAPDEQVRLRKLLNIQDVYEFKDRRLELPILFDESKAVRVYADGSATITIEKLLPIFRNQTGVTLEASAELKARQIGIVPQKLREVRHYMEAMSDALEASWTEKEGDYFLAVPAAAMPVAPAKTP
jgi:hypothetical protein